MPTFEMAHVYATRHHVRCYTCRVVCAACWCFIWGVSSSYIQYEDDEEILDRAEGTKIEWKEGANLCFKSHPLHTLLPCCILHAVMHMRLGRGARH